MIHGERLIAIVGILLIFAAVFVILDTENSGLVTRGSISADPPRNAIAEASPEVRELFSVPTEEVSQDAVVPVDLSFSIVTQPSDVGGKIPPRMNMVLSDDLLVTNIENNPFSTTQIQNQTPSIIGAVNFYSLKDGKPESMNEFVSNSFIIQFDSAIEVQNQRAMSLQLDSKLRQIADYSIRKLAPNHQNDFLGRFVVVNFKGEARSRIEVQKKIENISGVTHVSPNYIVKTSSATFATIGLRNPTSVNDTYFLQQYMHKTLNSIGAWGQTLGNGSIIAVIDTGVDWRHEDLLANIWVNSREIPNNGIDDEGNGYIDDIVGYDFVDTTAVDCDQSDDCQNEDNDPDDRFGHGTHVSGIIAAVTNNSMGIAGICPLCKIMALRAGYSPGYLEGADIIQAIIYAVDNGATVINMSYGGYINDPAEKAALDYATSRGVILIAAAGNDNVNRRAYPGSYENVIGVTATGLFSQKASFSNYGYWTDIAAPGVDILSTVPTNGYYLSRYYPPLPTNSRYANFSGTSMAAPIVAGLAGLVRASTSGGSIATIQSGIMSGVNTFEDDLQTVPPVFIGNGVADSLLAINRTRRDSSAILTFDDTVFDHAQSGNIVLTGKAFATSFGSLNLDVYDLTSSIPLPGRTIKLTTPPPNGNLSVILLTETLPNGEYKIRGTLRDSSGQIMRITQKPIKINNLEVTTPTQYLAINPGNGPISFIGTIAGSTLIQYNFEYRTDPNQPFSNGGFTYPGNTTPKYNELVATWNPPPAFPDSTVVEIRASVQFPQQTNQITNHYSIDRTIKQGWPVNLTYSNLFHANWNFPSLLPWNNDNGFENTAFMTTVDYIGQASAEIHVYSPTGSELNGWPQYLPVTYGGLEFWGSAGDLLSLADVDGDGKDELLVRADYKSQDAFETQTVIFSYNEDGTQAAGFPIVTNFPLIPPLTGRALKKGPVVVSDLDGDGVKELLVFSAIEINYVSQTPRIGIARKNAQGIYQFSNIHVTIPMTTPSFYFDDSLSSIVVQNMDADSDLEIMGIMMGNRDPSIIHLNEQYIFAINADGSSVNGWPKKIGDLLNPLAYERVETISGGMMHGQTVLAVTTGHYDVPTQTLGQFIYLFDQGGNVIPGWPVNIPSIPNSTSNFRAPAIFSDIDGDTFNELVIASTNVIDAYDLTGTLRWVGTHNPDFHFVGSSLTSVRNRANHSVVLYDFFNLPIFSAGPTTTIETIGFEPAVSSTNVLSKNTTAYPDFSKTSEAVLFRNGNNANLGQAISLEMDPGQPIQRYQLIQWERPINLVLGDWPVFLANAQRTNSGRTG